MSANFGSYGRLVSPPEPEHTCPDCDTEVDHPGHCAECDPRICRSCGEHYDYDLSEQSLCKGCELLERDWI